MMRCIIAITIVNLTQIIILRFDFTVMIARLRMPLGMLRTTNTNHKTAIPLDAGGFVKPLGWLFYGALLGHVVSALRARPTLKTMRPVCPSVSLDTPYGRAGRSWPLRVGRAPTASDVAGFAPTKSTLLGQLNRLGDCL